MSTVPFSPEYSSATKSFVLGVLLGEGFEYDPMKDSDLDDIEGVYLEKGGGFFLFLDDGEIIGTSAVKPLGSGICEIKRIYVKKECRGKGIGSDMFERALEYAGENFSVVRLKTDLSLETAIAMYLKKGFTVTKEEKGTIYFEKVL
ncbi:GNAT family N-acetyltransferase [Methanolobus sp. WCC4]|uniref:GNAT family N-acetyltransferase n=1 Tax=Methanolobus sp. WCC4 TaxID=3125784 RepID=UPI0030F70382